MLAQTVEAVHVLCAAITACEEAGVDRVCRIDGLPLSVREITARLLKPGGSLIFTNINRGNPYRVWLEYLANGSLIERDEAEIRQLCSTAGVSDDRVELTRRNGIGAPRSRSARRRADMTLTQITQILDLATAPVVPAGTPYDEALRLAAVHERGAPA